MAPQTLRPYQQTTLDAIGAAFAHGRGRQLVQAATGTGKTTVFAHLPLALAPFLGQFAPGDRRMLVIAHREELIAQAIARIQQTCPHLFVDREQGEYRATPLADVVVASIQTLAARRFTRLHRLMDRRPFRIVVVDEAHHAAAPSYRTALVHLGFLPPADATDTENIEAADYDDVEVMEAALTEWDAVPRTDRLLVGFTATPNRTDAIGLGCVFQQIVSQYPIRKAIGDQWLVPIVPWVVESTERLDNVRIQHGDFNQRQLADAVNTDDRNHRAVKAWQQYGQGASTLAFTVDVAHAHALAEAFRAAGVSAEPVSGETPTELRASLLRRYMDGDIRVLTNCMVLTEGTDLPRTACILHAKPTKSATLYEQMTGRGLRTAPGKDSCVVIDVVDIAEKHSLQTAPVLFGLPPGLRANGTELEALAKEWEELKNAVPGVVDLVGTGATIEQLRVKARMIDIWTIKPLGPAGEGARLDWLRTDEEQFAVSYPHPTEDARETIQVKPNLLGHFDVVRTVQPRDYKTHGPRQFTLAAEIPTAKEALILAEQWIMTQRPSAHRMKDQSASWRQKPASPGQIGLLKRLRVPFRPGVTSGEASQLIELSRANRARFRRPS